MGPPWQRLDMSFNAVTYKLICKLVYISNVHCDVRKCETDRILVENVEMIEIAIIPTIFNKKMLKLIYSINMHHTTERNLLSFGACISILMVRKSIFMHEYHYILYHFVRRSDCTYIIFSPASLPP